MLDKKRTLELFALFTDLPHDQLDNWKCLCENATVLLLGKLKKDTPISTNMERLCTAAAALAYGDYMLLNGSISSSGEEFKVGDISFKNSNSTNNSAQLDSQSIRDYFCEQIADLLSPATFALLAVPYREKS